MSKRTDADLISDAGDNVGLLLADVNKEDIQRGEVLLGSGSEFGWRS